MLCALVLLECCKHLCVCVIFVLFYFSSAVTSLRMSPCSYPLSPPHCPPFPPPPPTPHGVSCVCSLLYPHSVVWQAPSLLFLLFLFFFLVLRYYTPWVRDILQYQSLGVSVLLLFCLFLFFVYLFSGAGTFGVPVSCVCDNVG